MIPLAARHKHQSESSTYAFKIIFGVDAGIIYFKNNQIWYFLKMDPSPLGAKYAEVGCKSMDTFGCMSMHFGCMYAAFGCMSMARLGACMRLLGACLTVGSFA